MPTIKDIAREAGVSHGTVSNVLNKTGKVSIEKIRLVENAAKKLGYVPNIQAQLLKQGITRTVALILPSLCEDIYLDLYNAVQTTLFKADYDVNVYPTNDIASIEEAILKRIPQSGLTAVVTVSCLGNSGEELYRDLPCPVIYIDRDGEPVRPNDMFIRFDYEKIGAAIGRHILDSGRREVAVFSTPPSFSRDQLLIKGLEDAVNGSAVSIRHFTSTFNLAINTAFDIVQAGVRFDAIVTSSLSRAEAVQSALRISYAKERPEIITLSNSGGLAPADFLACRLDFSQMGVRIADQIIRWSRQKESMPPVITMEDGGFPQALPQIPKKAVRTLTMLTLDTPTTNALDKLLPMFEAESGIHLKLIRTSAEDLAATADMLSDDFCYDLIRMDVARMDVMGRKTYMPLSEAGITPETLPQTLIRGNYDNYSLSGGAMYTLPFDPSVQLLLYRSDLFDDTLLRRAYFERYHETLSVPVTIGQYLQTAEFFTAACSPNSPTRYGTTIMDQTAFATASDFMPYYLANVSDAPQKASGPAIRTGEMAEAMRQYLRMLDFAGRPQSWRGCVRLLTEGSVAMTVVYSNYAANIISSGRSHMIGKIGAAVVPGRRPLLGGGVVGICRYSKNVEACREFLRWYFTPDISTMIVRLGGTSPLADTYNNFKNFVIFPWLPATQESFALGSRGVSSQPTPDGCSIWDYEFSIGTAVKNMIAGDMSPEEAVNMAQVMYGRSGTRKIT